MFRAFVDRCAIAEVFKDFAVCGLCFVAIFILVRNAVFVLLIQDLIEGVDTVVGPAGIMIGVEDGEKPAFNFVVADGEYDFRQVLSAFVPRYIAHQSDFDLCMQSGRTFR